MYNMIFSNFLTMISEMRNLIAKGNKWLVSSPKASEKQRPEVRAPANEGRALAPPESQACAAGAPRPPPRT